MTSPQYSLVTFGHNFLREHDGSSLILNFRTTEAGEIKIAYTFHNGSPRHLG